MLALLVTLALSHPPMPGPCREVKGEQRVVLGKGLQKVVTVPGLHATAFTGEDEKIADVRMIGQDQLLIVGWGEGLARVSTFGSEGRRELVVGVVINNGWDGISDISRIFNCDTRIETRMVGDRIYLEGNAETLDDWHSVRKARTFSNVVSFVKLNPRFADRALHDANQTLLKAGFTTARVVVAGKKALLEGDVPAGDEERVRALIAPWITWLESLLDDQAPEPTWAPAPDA